MDGGIGIIALGNDWERKKMIFQGSDGDYALAMYPLNQSSSAGIISPLIDLSGTGNPYLTFDVNANDSDGQYIYISKDDGATWEFQSGIFTYPDTQNKWKKIRVNMSPYKEKQIRIRITGQLSRKSYPEQFIYLDNIRVTEFPLIPENLQLEQNAPNELRLSWNTVENATHYIVERKAGSSSYALLDSVQHPDNTILDKNLTTGMIYKYRLYAYNEMEDGYSGYSNIISKEVINPPIIIQPISDHKINAFKIIEIPIIITYAGPRSDLQYSIASRNTSILSGSDISLEETSTGLLCLIEASLGVIGNSDISIQVFNSTYTAIGTFNISIIEHIPQTISFEIISSKTYGDDSFTLFAVASSGLPVSYTTSNSSVATIDGSTIKIEGAGTTIITASQEGNDNYEPAANKMQNLIINKATQQITFDELPEFTYGDDAFDLTAFVNSGLSVGYTSSNSSVATIDGSTIKIEGAGTTIITASQEGNDNYEPAANKMQTLIINKATQQITFDELPEFTYGVDAFDLTAFVNSGLSVGYTSSNSSVATIDGSTIKIEGAGTAVITASREGNDNYEPAANEMQTLIINKATQQITFDELPEFTYGDDAFDLSAFANSGLSVGYTSSNSSVATIDGNKVKIIGAGTAVITASREGNDNYEPAANEMQTLIINKATQQITFDELPEFTIGDKSISLIAFSSSGLPISFESSNKNIASVSGNILTIDNAGNALITASQNGDSNFYPAASISRTLIVNLITAINDERFRGLESTSIYPNPAREIVTFNFGDLSGLKQLVISDMDGKIILKKDIVPNEIDLDLHSLPP